MANYKAGLNSVVWEVLQHLLTLASSHVKSCCNSRFVIEFMANLEFAMDNSESCMLAREGVSI